jgi:hypothetical protein
MSGPRIADARPQPQEDGAGGDEQRTDDGDRPAVRRAAALQRDAETDDEQAAEDERPDERVEVRGVELQNDSSGIVRQVSSRDATTASQAVIFGSS